VIQVRVTDCKFLAGFEVPADLPLDFGRPGHPYWDAPPSRWVGHGIEAGALLGGKTAVRIVGPCREPLQLAFGSWALRAQSPARSREGSALSAATRARASVPIRSPSTTGWGAPEVIYLIPVEHQQRKTLSSAHRRTRSGTGVSTGPK
jgi:hypothetical protein